ncbi:MAG: cell division protein ZapA, partial [Lachnospiraceae bacterium]|nr:cell division protein ZapA [Lachnospiraceae bacterium]
MAARNGTEVVIDGKVIKLSGYESEEYLQRLASYLNGKIAEYNRVESFKRQSADMQSILL